MQRVWSLCLLVLAGACTTSNPPAETFDREGMLRAMVDVVIIPSFQASVDSATALHTSVGALCTTPDTAALTAAQDAWRTARRDWKRTLAFQFGPVEELLAGSAVDTWPTAFIFLEGGISGATVIDEAFVHGRSESQRGLPALEYLLFGTARDNAAALERLAPAGTPGPRCQYLVAAASELTTNLQAVVDAWRNQYREEFTSAGKGSATYPTVKAAVDQVVNQLVVASEAIAGARLAQPLGLRATGAPEPTLVESPFSDNAAADMLDILQGMENLHRCRLGSEDSLGLDDFLRSTSAETDASVLQEIEELRAGLQSIPAPLRIAVVDHNALVHTVYQHSRDVKRVFGTNVVAALGVTLVFNDNDGD